MESYGVPIPRMDWDCSNLPEAWRKFRQHAELMFTGPLREKDEADKCSYLLLWVGEKGRDVYNTWNLTADEAKKLQTYYDKYTEYITPKANPIYARYKFHQQMQGEHETFEQFVTELKLLVKDCGYPNSDEMVRDRIVFGTNSPSVREKLLNQGAELTLDKAIDIARSHELAKQQLKTMGSAKEHSHQDTLHAVSRKQYRSATPQNAVRHKDETGAYKICSQCARQHSQKDTCPAKGKQCIKCKKFNHFAKACRSKIPFQHKPRHKMLHSVGESKNSHQSSDEETGLYIDSITIENEGQSNEQAYADLELGSPSRKVRFKVDTGAQANTIPANLFQTLFHNVMLRPANHRLTDYGGHSLNVDGTCKLRCKHKDQSLMLDFHVVDTNSPPVLAMKACRDLNLIKIVMTVIKEKTDTGSQNILEEFKDVFQGIGVFPGECNFHVDAEVTPVVCPPRRIPFALRSKLKEELESMEKNGIICKVTEPTAWVNALVVVEKPKSGNLRVCLDPRPLNKAIQRPYYPLPTLEDVTAKLAGAKYFSVLDARSGYWNIKLSHESSLLTTFNTVFGRYRFLRLPFGIISAQDEFQRRVDETYEGLDGVAAIVDDVLVFGKTKQEHDRNLRPMLQRTRERGVKLNPDKCRISVQEVSYFGHTLSHEGLKPDPRKIKAVQEMQAPQNKTELETVLGMFTYLARFAPHLSEVNAPLRLLLKEDNDFKWDAAQDRAFQRMKDLITQEPGPVLAYFDPQKELRLQVDASKSGLGAVMLQEGKPVAYASKSLNKTEQNYAQIEKELYAVLFGCKRFHEYIYGRKVVVESDHKPLESIIKKPLAAAPPQLQRMILQLQRYDISITHLPGKDIPVADTLSRKAIPYEDQTLNEGMEAQVHAVMSNVAVSDKRLTEIKEVTSMDPQLTTLKKVILDGWPETRSSCPHNIQEYWNYRDEISEFDGILFKGEKIIIPQALRKAMIDRIHSSHMGIEKSKSRARDILFWPQMGKQIEEAVMTCHICQERRSSNPRELLMSHAIPERPWQVIGTDLFSWNSRDYIVIVDYLSRYFELERLYSCTSAAVIAKLKAAMARHGIPEIVISDNGPCYRSKEFSQFAESWGFTHTTTSPHYPQSNGLAEKTVQTAKRILDKARAEGKDSYLSLLEYRNTPVDNLHSPAQLLMSRRLRSILPNTPEQLKPQVTCQESVRFQREVCQQRQQTFFNKCAKPLTPLSAGTPISYQQEDGSWKSATVTQPANTPRSYHITTAEGQTLRRNRRHLRERHSDSKEVQIAEEVQQPDLSVKDPKINQPTPAESQSTEKDTLPNDRPPVYVTKSGRAVKPKQIFDM
uniref:Gypsy retrotransposon integrase-like protein 1 n=1 Tax=Oryzias latipes TaxID=8090 RepID=A0A3P9K9H2_ORYLA